MTAIETTYFELGSSEVDWCETNYTVSQYIAEFFNTISNIFFFIVPPIAFSLFKPYTLYVTRGVYIIIFLMMLVGVGSVYFHSTLSLAGQLMDELLILWVVMISYAILMPIQFLPLFFRNNIKVYQLSVFLFTCGATMLCMLQPILNAYFLMMFSIPIMVLLVVRTKRSDNKRVIELGKRTVLVWTSAVVFWILDRVLCDFWLRINLPYFHSVFHVIAFYSSYWSFVLYSYFKAVDTVPQLRASISYWPDIDSCQSLAIPYIQFMTPSSNIVDNQYVLVNLNSKPSESDLVNGQSFKFA